MNLRRLLTSSIGWRVFVLYMFAAAVPVALLAILSSRAVEDAAGRALSQTLAGHAKATALLTVDRLRVAQQYLRGGSHPETGATTVPDVTADLPPIEAAVVVDPQQPENGALGRLGPVQIAAVVAAARRADQRDALVVVPPIGSGHKASLVIAQRAPHERWRLGVVNADYLWQDTGDLPPGFWVCVVSQRRDILFCPDDVARAHALDKLEAIAFQRGHAESGGASVAGRDVFLSGNFATENWLVVAGAEGVGEEASGGALRTRVIEAAIAGILLAALLSLTQLRRMLVPLQRLRAGARSLAGGQFDARIDVSSQDEFAELAAAFNDMAGRLERQFGELETLASIDRSMIASQLDAERFMEQLAERLVHLLPGHPVAVAVRVSPMLPRFVGYEHSSNGCHRTELVADADELARLDSARPSMMVPGGRAPLGLGQAALAEDCARVELIPVKWRGEVKGFLALGFASDSSDVEQQTRRHLLELRDRLAIALASHERDAQLMFHARNDSLTGLLNRHGLKEEFAQLARQRRHPGDELAVLYVDVDRFKSVNDTLGHHAGDRVLQLVAERCAGALPEGARLSRPAGDEFVVLLDAPDVRDLAQRVAADICTSLASPLTVGDTVFFLGASIGIAFYPEHGTSIETLLRCADVAMYQSKARGSGEITLFDERFDQQAQLRHWIDRDLHAAVAEGQLHLQYQPRVLAGTQHICSVEALVRWFHPVHGLVAPADFIPVAEESDLILEIGEWVMDTACRQTRAWRDSGLVDLRVAVNVSVRQLRQPDLDVRLAQATQRWGVPPSCIEIEITESVLVTDIEHVKGVLTRVRAAGFTVAIDDFGTGFSSLSYLRHLPFDILKIDRAFVLDLDVDPSARAIAQSIVALGKTLDKRIVAEGVETEAQARWLCAIGCDEIQGFHHGRPVDGQRLDERLLTTGWVSLSEPS